jgi:hypothetical protein
MPSKPFRGLSGPSNNDLTPYLCLFQVPNAYLWDLDGLLRLQWFDAHRDGSRLLFVSAIKADIIDDSRPTKTTSRNTAD